MPSVDELVSDIISREGGYVNADSDKGGPTKFGITAQVLGEWRHLGRTATRKEVMSMDEHEARKIYFTRYVTGPQFDKIPDDEVRAHVVDIGVNSGPVTAAKMFQRAIGMHPAKVDGIVGEETLSAFLLTDAARVRRRLVSGRIEFYLGLGLDGKDVQEFLETHTKSQLHNLRGWVRRSMEFF